MSTKATPILPRITDKTMQKEQVKPEKPETVAIDVEDELPEETSASIPTKLAVASKVRGLFTSAYENKIIIIIIVLIVCIIGIVAYVVVRKDKEGKPNIVDKIKSKFQKDKEPAQPPEGIHNYERAQTQQAQNQQPQAQQQQNQQQQTKPQPPLTHENIMNIPDDQLLLLKQQREQQLQMQKQQEQIKQLKQQAQQQSQLQPPQQPQSSQPQSSQPQISQQQPQQPPQQQSQPQQPQKQSIEEYLKAEAMKDVDDDDLETTQPTTIPQQPQQPETPPAPTSSSQPQEITIAQLESPNMSASAPLPASSPVVEVVGVNFATGQSQPEIIQPAVLKCKQLLASGRYCKNNAVTDGFCTVHKK